MSKGAAARLTCCAALFSLGCHGGDSQAPEEKTVAGAGAEQGPPAVIVEVDPASGLAVGIEPVAISAE